MPCDVHRKVQAIILFAALSMALAACEPAADGERGAVASTSPAVEAPTEAPTSKPTSHKRDAKHWQCGDLPVDSQLHDDAMQLKFPGQTLALQQMASAAGMRYADSAGNAFTREGDDASLTLAGGGQYECTRRQRASPWTEAAARGIAFRAVGSEPGWLVDIGKGGVPSLHAILDYGQRSVDVAQMHQATRGFEGRTADGTVVTLEVSRSACQDGMSGESFEAEATLVVGDKSYRGCGAFLSE